MEDQEALESHALVGKFADSVQNVVDHFLANGVVTAREVVGCVFFAGDELLWVEQLTVSPCSNFVCNRVNSVSNDHCHSCLKVQSLYFFGKTGIAPKVKNLAKQYFCAQETFTGLFSCC